MFNADIKLFDVNITKLIKDNNAMVVSVCNGYIGQMLEPEKRVYSELEQESYAYLNNNDYNGKIFELEISLNAN